MVLFGRIVLGEEALEIGVEGRNRIAILLLTVFSQDLHEGEDVRSGDADHQLDHVLEDGLLGIGELRPHHAFHHEAQEPYGLVDEGLALDAATLHVGIAHIEEIERQLVLRRDVCGGGDIQPGQLFGELGLAIDHHHAAVFFARQVMGDDVLNQIGFAGARGAQEVGVIHPVGEANPLIDGRERQERRVLEVAPGVVVKAALRGQLFPLGAVVHIDHLPQRL